jgi:hypothetical protein
MSSFQSSQRASGENARLVESLVENVLRRLPELTDVLVATIRAENPGYNAIKVVPRDDLWRSCHDNLTRVLQLVSESNPYDDEHFDAAWATGRKRAEQRMPLDDVLGSFRIGGRLIWQALIEKARDGGNADAGALLDVATRVWEVVDTTSMQVANAYHAAERELVRADEQRNATVWEGLLLGRARDAAFAYESARIIGLPVSGDYCAVATDHGAGGDALAGVLEDRLAASGLRSAWQVRANTMVGLVAVETDRGNGRLGTVLNALGEVVSVPTGVSLVVHGLAEADIAYRQALLARRTVVAGGANVVGLEQRLPEALLLGSPELADRLVQSWLGPLLALPAGEGRLLIKTLEAWVATAGSPTRTAALAHCHRNTVLNRLSRIRDVTGHDFSADATPLELVLSLRAANLGSLSTMD